MILAQISLLTTEYSMGVRDRLLSIVKKYIVSSSIIGNEEKWKGCLHAVASFSKSLTGDHDRASDVGSPMLSWLINYTSTLGMFSAYEWS